MGNPDNLEALIASRAMERLEIYLRNGRRLRDVPLDTLRTVRIQEMRAWMKAWTEDHRAKFDHREHEDIESEMALRKIDPPFDKIKDVFKALRQASDKQIDDLMADPERLARKEKEIDDALDSFEAEDQTQQELRSESLASWQAFALDGGGMVRGSIERAGAPPTGSAP